MVHPRLKSLTSYVRNFLRRKRPFALRKRLLLQLEQLTPRIQLTGSPIAVDDYFALPLNSTTAEIAVLQNDTVNGNQQVPLRVSAVSQSSHGNIRISEDGQRLVYEPTAAFQGYETISYTITDETAQASAILHLFVGIEQTPASALQLADTPPTNPNGSLNSKTATVRSKSLRTVSPSIAKLSSLANARSWDSTGQLPLSVKANLSSS